MKQYEQIDISGDAGLRIYGNDPEELFENAAKGLFSMITDVTLVKESETKDVNLSSDSMENLLVQWLNELVFLFDTYYFIGKVFSVCLDNNNLLANVSGGLFDPAVDESRLLIKAATYHNLSLRNTGSNWEATVIFDI